MNTGILRVTALSAALLGPSIGMAQQVWVQVQALNDAEAAERAAEGYAEATGAQAETYDTPGAWYAIVLGPFQSGEGTSRRDAFRSAGLIPADSFITDGRRFESRLFSTAAEAPAPAPAARLLLTEPDPAPAQETVAEARRSEAALTPQDRRGIQIALQWAGVYDAGIDGDFGRGTRAAMTAWQEANGFEATGVMTTAQRAALIGQYNAVLEGLGLEVVEDTEAGVAVAMPTARVAFARYAPPFAQYDATSGEDTARVLILSQQGGPAELRGLYDILQSLEIVPPEGERERREDSFTLVGRDGDIVSHTEARVADGAIKGFTLVWPAGDEEVRGRLVGEMRDSLRTTAAVLPERMRDAVEQSPDLLSGLRIRTPAVSRSGFFVNAGGDVLTTAEVAEGCDRITLETEIEADVLSIDPETGLALLSPTEALAPRAYASFLEGTPRLGDRAVLAGYSFSGRLGAPSLTYGTLADVSGLAGEAGLSRLDLEAREGDAGGPILSASGAVTGMLLPDPAGQRTLPGDTAIAADAETIVAFLSGAGVTASRAAPSADMARGPLERSASDMTVLVGCWR